jgi:outer membrane biosynthesis protein TonB
VVMSRTGLMRRGEGLAICHRKSSGSRPRGPVGALSLCLAVAVLAPAPAAGTALAPRLPVEIPSLAGVEVALPRLKVEVPLLPKVEVTLPKVELPLPKVEVPLPKVEVTPPPQPEVSPPPPTTSTPAPTPTPKPTPPPTSPSAPNGESRAEGAVGKSSRASRKRRRVAVRQVSSGSGAGGHLLAVSSTAPLAAGASPGHASAAGSHSPTAGSASPLDAIGKQLPVPLPVPDWSKPIILLLVLAALWFGARSRLAAMRSRRLESQRDVLLQDLSAMQAALVPVIPRRMGELAVSVAYRPAEGPAAGGDFYDVFMLDSGNVAVLLGDVAGHGHEALTQAALTRYTLRAYLQAGLSPRAVLALAGNVLADAAAAHFATVAVAVYDSVGGTLTYASAGHPAPISVGFDTPEPLTICCSPPVGWDVPTGRRQTTLSLPAGAVVCFFSDGLIEARTKDGLLGRERLAAILAELGPRPSSAELLERVQANAEATPDDMVSCILAPLVGPATTSGHVEELELDAADLDGEGVGRFLAACGVAAAEIATALAQARAALGAQETVVLQIECPANARAAATVLSGAEAPPVDAPGYEAVDVSSALAGHAATVAGGASGAAT